MLHVRNGVLLLSFAAAAIAVFLAIRPQAPLGTTEISYCYDSIITLSDDDPSDANCFAVSPLSKTFTRVFKDHSSPATTNLIRNNGTTIPGLWDGHGHILMYGELLQTINLFGSESLADVNDRVKAYLKGHPGEGTSRDWIRGTGWDQAAFGRMPVAADFEDDPGLEGKYIMMSRVDAHCIWVSQAVLDLLPDPIPQVPGGEVITDPGKGVFCDNAMDMVLAFWPKPTLAQTTKYVKAALEALHEVGLVGVHDASVLPATASLYNDLIDAGEWTLRIYAMMECPQRNTFCPDLVNRIVRDDYMLTTRAIKLFGDGALGSWGSAMIEPYSDHPHSKGSLLVNASTMAHVTRQWAKAGYQVNIHAIGDMANRVAVDAFSSAYPFVCPDKPAALCQERTRFRIEHAQIIHPDDQNRIFDLGIIPSVQPTHATSDMAYAENRLGPERTASEAYRMKSFLSLLPVLGSDFPVEPPNPLHGMYAAITRRSPATGLGRHGADEGWFSSEALSLNEALRGFTVNPARAAFLEGKAGMIAKDAFADWVVLDEPLSVEKLRSTKVRETWVAGKRVYERLNDD